MNIKFFLKAAGIEVSKKTNPNGSESYRVGDTYLRMVNGNPAISANERWAEPPENLKKHVVRVEVDSVIGISGLRRRSGLYRLGNAEGVAQFYPAENGSNDKTNVEVSAPTKEEALELWDKILDGLIAPDLDYEAPQVSIPTISHDRLIELETQAADMAMTLLETAMKQLNERVTPTS